MTALACARGCQAASSCRLTLPRPRPLRSRAQVVERNTLKRQCPTLLTLLKSFPATLELQEPTFKDIVVVYRKAYPARAPPSSSNKLATKTKEERMQGILNYRNIYIKVPGAKQKGAGVAARCCALLCAAVRCCAVLCAAAWLGSFTLTPLLSPCSSHPAPQKP